MEPAVPTYSRYHAERLAARVQIVAFLAVVAFGMYIAVGLGGEITVPVRLLIAFGFAGIGLALGRAAVAEVAVLLMSLGSALVVMFSGPADSALRPEWGVFSAMGFAALTPLTSPVREVNSVAWLGLLALRGVWRGDDLGADGTLAIAGAVLIGHIVARINVDVWKRAWEDTLAQRHLHEQAALARDDLEAAVARTRAELAVQQGRLVEQERLATLGRLAAGIAHEINNPLAVAVTNLEMARQDRDPALLADAEQALHRIRDIVADLSKVARPDDLDHVAAVPLDQVCAYAADVVRVLVKGQIRIRVNTLNVSRVRANRGRLEQVMVNLLVNAWQALAARGRGIVSVDAVDRDGVVEIHVDDDGPGIPEGEHEHIFEPFFTTKPAGEGTGLGLPISRSYLRTMGGDIYATRSPLGGARFVVTLPAAAFDEDEPATWTVPALPDAYRSETPVTPTDDLPVLLLIDDEPALRRSLSRGLRKEWHVITASTLHEAVAALAKGPIHAVLCDLVLTDSDGIDVLSALSRRWPEALAHTILMSGEPAGDRLVNFAQANAEHLVKKPFELEALRERLRGAAATHLRPVRLDPTRSGRSVDDLLRAAGAR